MENKQVQQTTLDTRVKTPSNKKKTKKREFKSRKTFSLKAMEELTNQVSFLQNEYDKLAVDAQETLGYNIHFVKN
jgi:hypothetical protein